MYGRGDLYWENLADLWWQLEFEFGLQWRGGRGGAPEPSAEAGVLRGGQSGQESSFISRAFRMPPPSLSTLTLKSWVVPLSWELRACRSGLKILLCLVHKRFQT